MPLRSIKISDCKYTSDWQEFPNPPVDHFNKLPGFAWQAEKKAIFLPQDGKAELTPQIVQIRLSDLVEFLEFSNYEN